MIGITVRGMKATVYIPDELLERARALNPDANTSQLVQRGLERLSPAEDVAYARRPKMLRNCWRRQPASYVKAPLASTRRATVPHW